ncbi:MAG TPA: response regulator [Micropepsaceae bacterium]|nr:response regulator [Micropepsaceae bacterium]
MNHFSNLSAAPPTVLLVEDDVALLDMLRRTLERAGFAVITAVHGIDALAKMRSFVADVVITDIMMPEMDGFELIRSLHGTWPDLPIVAMSGIEDTVNFPNMALKFGARAALAKPVNRSHLVQLIRDILATAPLTRRIAQA